MAESIITILPYPEVQTHLIAVVDEVVRNYDMQSTIISSL
jgi:hypothetical protein